MVGLFKGSVTPDSESSQYAKLERPTTLKQLKTVYRPNDCIQNGSDDSRKSDYATGSSPSRCNAVNANSVTTNGTDKNVSMSILSPFDEQEEWAKISEIMASFGSNFNRESIVTELEQEFESRLGTYTCIRYCFVVGFFLLTSVIMIWMVNDNDSFENSSFKSD